MMNAIRGSFSRLRFLSPLSKLFGQVTQTSPRGALLNASLSVEEPDLYQTGGFHRVSLGDKFDSGKYTVLRKLGYGQYSTVWLARDSVAEKYVALKILRADCYGGPHDILEREILGKITNLSRKSKHEGRRHVTHLLDQFNHSGSNGEHVCFVFDVLGHHLDHQTAHYKHGRIPVKAARIITRQILLGLDFLHSECGVIHTDLKPTNILLELEHPDETILKYLSEVPPRTGIERKPGTDTGTVVPMREVISTPLVSEMHRINVRLIDFGVASWTHNHLSNLIQSPALRAPEVTIGAPWGPAVDIWSLGCLIIEFIQGIVLFRGEAAEDNSWTADDDRLAKMIEILGPFTPEFLERGSRSAHFFDESGNLRRIPNMGASSLERMLNGKEMPFLKAHDMPAGEVPVLIDFLRGMLALDPENRKSAAELLRHEWLEL